MRNYISLIPLAVASAFIIVTYDFGKPDLPYTHEEETVEFQTEPNASVRTNNTAKTTIPEENQNRQTGINPIYKMQLELAVVAARASAQCGYSTGGGYRHLKPEQAANELVMLMNSAQQPVPGETQVSKSPIMYVMDKPDAPWQVVIRADTESNQLVIEGFAVDQKVPVFSETVPCS